jgi:hypothetical protein
MPVAQPPPQLMALKLHYLPELVWVFPLPWCRPDSSVDCPGPDYTPCERDSMDIGDWLRWTLPLPLEHVYETGLASSYLHFVRHIHLILLLQLLLSQLLVADLGLLLHLMYPNRTMDHVWEIIELHRFVLIPRVILRVDYHVR